jgi:hypothetical protein
MKRYMTIPCRRYAHQLPDQGLQGGAEEEDFRICGIKAPMCTLSNMSPGPPVVAPLSVCAPLEPIKGKARSLEHKF